MVTSNEARRGVGDLAMGQWGLVTAGQARREGLSAQQLARLADAGALERLRHGVYRVAGAPSGPQDDLCAAWLALAPGRTAQERVGDPDVEVVSHRSAAVLHQLGDLDADRLEFTTRARKQSRDAQVLFHRGALGAGQWTLLDGLPVTTVLVTIGDLAAARIDGGHLAGVVRDAVTTQHLDVDEVATALSAHAHHYGAPLGQGTALLRQMLQQAGVPQSTRAVGRLVEPYLVTEAIRQIVAQATDTEAIRQIVAQATGTEAIRQIVAQALDIRTAADAQHAATTRERPGQGEDG